MVKALWWLISASILLAAFNDMMNTVGIVQLLYVSLALSAVVGIAALIINPQDILPSLRELRHPKSPGGFVVPLFKPACVTALFTTLMMTFGFLIIVNSALADDRVITEVAVVNEKLSGHNIGGTYVGVGVYSRAIGYSFIKLNSEGWSRIEIGDELPISYKVGFFELPVVVPQHPSS